jgi:hypothetical protein
MTSPQKRIMKIQPKPDIQPQPPAAPPITAQVLD